MGFKTEKNTGILIKKAARLFEQAANLNLDQLGVTYSQTIFLVRLWERDGQSQIELAKGAGLKQPSVVRILDRMERDGLITRTRNEADRRVFNFFLTNPAKAVCQQLQGQANTMHKLATRHFSKETIEELNATLLGVIENLQAFLLEQG